MINKKYKFVGNQDCQSMVAVDDDFDNHLRTNIQEIAKYSDYYKSQWNKVYTNDAISAFNKLPKTTKANYRNTLQEEAFNALENRPFITDFSSGSTSKCVLRYSSLVEELGELEITREVFELAGVRSGDHFLCMEVGVPEIYDFYCRAARQCGATQTTFLKMTADAQASVEPLRLLKPTVILSLPSVLIRAWPMLKTFWAKGKCPIKSIIHMGEPMSALFRKELEETLDCKVYSFYGTTETGGIGGECCQQDGCHFDPHKVIASIENPQIIDEQTIRGDGLFTTLQFRYQSVIKYQVGDEVEVTCAPCKCGDSRPRVKFIQRTNDSFIITGEKFRYKTVLNALRRIVPNLELLSILLEDDREDSGRTHMHVSFSDDCQSQEEELLKVLKYDIFELDTAWHNGFVRFSLSFISQENWHERKTKRVIDTREFYNDCDVKTDD